jgi:hypothetical protein
MKEGKSRSDGSRIHVLLRFTFDALVLNRDRSVQHDSSYNIYHLDDLTLCMLRTSFVVLNPILLSCMSIRSFGVCRVITMKLTAYKVNCREHIIVKSCLSAENLKM